MASQGFDASVAALDELAASAALLLGDGDAPDDKRARRRAQVASSSRRQRLRHKTEALELRAQAALLETQLEQLRSKHKQLRVSNEAAEWEEKAITQRLRRRHAEQTNTALRASVYQHARYLLDFRSVFSSSPLVSSELNLREILHAYVHLPTDPAARARDYLAICTNDRLDLAAQIFARETSGMSVVSPTLTTRTIQEDAHGQRFGVTVVGAFSFDTLDVKHVFDMACNGLIDCVSEWPRHHVANTYGVVVDSPSGTIRYGIADTTYQSDESGAHLALQSRVLSFSRLTDSYGVLLLDYVDDDDLYPIPSNLSLRHDRVGGILVRREVCEDGVERVVGRLISSKLYGRAEIIDNNGGLPPAIGHFAKFATSSAVACGTTVYNAIRSGTMSGCHFTV